MITVSLETEQLARKVAARSGRTPEDVLRIGVEREAHIAGVTIPEDARPVKPSDAQHASEIARRIAGRPLLDQRSPAEILDEAWGSTNDRGR